MKTYWKLDSYLVTEPDGVKVRYYWLTGCRSNLDIIRMARRLENNGGSKITIEIQHDEHLKYYQHANHHGVRVDCEIWEQEEPPPHPKDRITIYDNRARDDDFERKRLESHHNEPVRPGFKQLPMRLSFA